MGEIKKTSKFEKSATMQLAYYLYLLRQKGIEATGELLIPKEKKKITVILDESKEIELLASLEAIQSILSQEKPPLPIKIGFCAKCAYKEFCWS